jgi:hypothetical protein
MHVSSARNLKHIIYGRLSNQTGCDPGGGAKKRPRSGQEPSCTKSPFHQAARSEVLGDKDSAPKAPSVVSSVYLHIASRNITGAFIFKQHNIKVISLNTVCS